MPKGIPLMITQANKQRLRDAGFSDEAIHHLTPQQAFDILRLAPAAQEQIRRQLEPEGKAEPAPQPSSSKQSPAQTASNPLIALTHEIDTMVLGIKQRGTIDEVSFFKKIAALATEARQKSAKTQMAVRRYIDE